jgi:hypothetical protein
MNDASQHVGWRRGRRVTPHGVGSTVSQVLSETADVYAFLLWQMDVKGYQPGK